jgi:Domain of unknown function (DUF4091)
MAKKILVLAVITLVTFSCALGLTNKSFLSGPIVWVSPALERIGQNDPPRSTTSIELYAARGEYESFQIGIRAPKGGLNNVNVLVSELSGVNNQVIPKSNFTLYREHYVYVNNPSPDMRFSTNKSLGRGWYADGLIPFLHPETQKEPTEAKLDAVPFQLDDGKNQPIWVDVFVPRDARPGEYNGTFTVTSDQGLTTGKIVLKVWNFELPLQPSLNSAFSLYENKSKSAMAEVLKHKLMPVANFDPADERELIDKWGLRSLRIPFWSGANYKTCAMTSSPSVDTIRSAAAKHQSDLFLYVRYADEIDNCQNLDDLVKKTKEWAKNIHQVGVSTAMAITPNPALYDDGSGTGRSAVDIWIVLPKMYDADPKRISEVLQKGDKVWFYNALVQDGYSPKWQIDFEPINYRIVQGFINHSLGLTGILYWQVDLWTNDPWKNVESYSEGKRHYPGEGMLFYPGEQVGIRGIVPSMRVKWLREGVEDYEYIEILKGLGRLNWAIEVSRKVALDWKHWTRDPSVLESTRRKLGDEIEKLFLQRGKS